MADDTSSDVERLAVKWQSMHGHRGSKRWPGPRIVAKSDLANRADQGNTTKANEYLDDADILDQKMQIIADLIKESRFLTAYTGAGLSKASGIADYATKAVDTVVKAPKLKSALDAKPTFAHHCLTAMGSAGLLQHWVQQNHDGLPQKAGYPQEKINEIHGAWFDPSNPVVKFGGSLRGDLFDWMLEAEEKVDLCLCLGTSLSGMNADRMASTPAEKSLEDPPRALGTVIINLQRTGLDSSCAVRVWATLDDAFKILMDKLAIKVKPQTVKLPKGDVFTVPYDKDGAYDPESEMELNLKVGAPVKIAVKIASNWGASGSILKKDKEGDYSVDLGDNGTRRMGRWWVEAALRGAIPHLPVINVKPKVKKVPRRAPTTSSGVSGSGSGEGARSSGSSSSSGGKGRARHTSFETSGGGAESSASDGPTYSEVQPLPASFTIVQSHFETDDGKKNSHKWGLRLPNAGTFVEKVVWKLHPTFRNPNISCTKPPFAVSRVGWGTFVVNAEITLRADYGGHVLRAAHELTFDGSGKSVARTVVPTSK